MKQATQLVTLVVALAWLTPTVSADVDFNRDIRPILSENCFYCHGQDANHRKADLRLDVRDDAIKGKAFVPGDAAKSSLVDRIFTDDAEELMPPPKSNRKLSAKQKDLLKRWIAEGAVYKPHWTFIPPVRAELPRVRNATWVRNPIDRFVLARLEAEGLTPSPEADRTTLLRRLALDLTGRVPTSAEVDAFLLDNSPAAYENLVDRLLTSPAYGERMSLPWLDAARYADSNGFQQDGDTWQWMWRDWVVKSLNADMPFDQFSIEQLAGDLLPNATTDQKIATAFNRNHLQNGEGGAIPEEQRFVNLFDRVDTTATNWLGLTVACAQCHDHKYDPITQRDYYSLMAAFNNIPETGRPGGGPGRMRIATPFLELPTEKNTAELAAMEADLKKTESAGDTKKKFELALAEWEPKVTADTPEINRNLLPALRLAPDKRTDEDKKQLKSGLRSHFETKVWPAIAAKDPSAKKADALKKKIASYKNEQIPRVMVMQETQPRDTFILDRGEYLKPKDKVSVSTPGFLPPMPADAPKNRLGFARWLFAPEHPLTARVQVNRYWATFFGTGLIKTSEDLGVQSEVPIHPELLDWLAVEFRESGWRVKAMHRLIVTSATYRQSSKATPELIARDPENRLMARASRFRMPSMILRDIALATSGLLVDRVGGQPVYPYQPDAVWESLAITKERDFTYPASKGEDLYRKSLYTFWRRTVSPANMFDSANRQTCRVRSSVTSTPLHALTTMNDITWAEAARVLAEKAMSASETTDGQLAFAFRQVLSRKPSATEMPVLRRMLQRQQSVYGKDAKSAVEAIKVGEAPRNEKLNPVDHAAMSAVCLAILNLDEALTRE
ncbi:PSD1 and planctomycete cytochrome C domain-containing protein [Humisphaera borealis]|uniref:PSD1 domain-containing protein n=1 Tax=Humisphaera borealis TaxID=2807512 RepID=A0A7M2WTP7_9BACT|nr:PSD1 and planctomycete cytochrome C domain-containing protein [Humisphaera borealis]QOV88823.1 PSD1 domain-containing protein [Humisphaera borealis]